MESRVTEIAPDVFRISTFHPEPFLMHTGFKKMFALAKITMNATLE